MKKAGHCSETHRPLGSSVLTVSISVVIGVTCIAFFFSGVNLSCVLKLRAKLTLLYGGLSLCRA